MKLILFIAFSIVCLTRELLFSSLDSSLQILGFVCDHFSSTEGSKSKHKIDCSCLGKKCLILLLFRWLEMLLRVCGKQRSKMGFLLLFRYQETYKIF